MLRSTQYLFLLLIVVFVTKLTFQNSLTQQCGIRQVGISDRILYGNEANLGYWPWHAIVYHRKYRDLKYACGGTLITKNFVLTSQHCVIESNKYKMNFKNIFVQLGVNELNHWYQPSFQQHQVFELYFPPSFPRHDIALIELETEAQFNQFVQPACIYDSKNIIGLNGTAIGFGLTETGELSDVLKECTMPVVDGYECAESDIALRQMIDVSIICAGHTQGCKVCNGDSGGGLHFERNGVWYIVGITSYSPTDENNTALCKRTGLTAFTRVNNYLTWIRDTTKIRKFHQQQGRNITHQELLLPVSVHLELPYGTQFAPNSNITIGCKVVGYPQPTVNWFKDGRLMEPSNRVTIDDDHTLHVFSALPSDAGAYKCLARNGRLEAFDENSIRVEGVFIPVGCKDINFITNCTLKVEAGVCYRKYYGLFCCRSCTLAGQLDH